MIRINHPWGAGPWMQMEHLARARQWCIALNQRYGEGTHHIQYANILQRLGMWLGSKLNLTGVTDVRKLTDARGRDLASDALSMFSHSQIMLDAVAAHIEGRADVDHRALQHFANEMGRLADRIERSQT